MTIGATDLLDKHGSRLAVAEALLMGNISLHEEEFVPELVGRLLLKAAKIRLKAVGKLGSAPGKKTTT